MANFTDVFGASVTDNGDGSYTRGGVTIVAPGRAGALAAFNGMAPDGYVFPIVPVKTLSSLAYLERFTNAELAGFLANPAAIHIVLKITAAGTIDVTDPLLIARMQQAVTAGLLTAARRTQILNLAIASP